MKLFTDDLFDTSKKPQPPIKLDEDSMVYEVDKDVSQKIKNRRKQYLVKWVGYPDHKHTWLPKDEMRNCEDAITKLLKENTSSIITSNKTDEHDKLF